MDHGAVVHANSLWIAVNGKHSPACFLGLADQGLRFVSLHHFFYFPCIRHIHRNQNILIIGYAGGANGIDATIPINHFIQRELHACQGHAFTDLGDFSALQPVAVIVAPVLSEEIGHQGRSQGVGRTHHGQNCCHTQNKSKRDFSFHRFFSFRVCKHPLREPWIFLQTGKGGIHCLLYFFLFFTQVHDLHFLP